MGAHFLQIPHCRVLDTIPKAVGMEAGNLKMGFYDG